MQGLRSTNLATTPSAGHLEGHLLGKAYSYCTACLWLKNSEPAFYCLKHIIPGQAIERLKRNEQPMRCSNQGQSAKLCNIFLWGFTMLFCYTKLLLYISPSYSVLFCLASNQMSHMSRASISCFGRSWGPNHVGSNPD